MIIYMIAYQITVMGGGVATTGGEHGFFVVTTILCPDFGGGYSHPYMC